MPPPLSKAVIVCNWSLFGVDKDYGFSLIDSLHIAIDFGFFKKGDYEMKLDKEAVEKGTYEINTEKRKVILTSTAKKTKKELTYTKEGMLQDEFEMGASYLFKKKS